MFTGIIEELGLVKTISKRGNIALIEIKAEKVLADTKIGDSISINGVCLTVVKKDKDSLSFEAMPETMKSTNLGIIKACELVNLERSLMVGERLSGHFVTGHIDCIGIIRKRCYINSNLSFQIAIPKEFIKYCIPRGSVAVDGISLTLAEHKSNTFGVYIIPHTLKNTTLDFRRASDKVNIEFDILAKRIK